MGDGQSLLANGENARITTKRDSGFYRRNVALSDVGATQFHFLINNAGIGVHSPFAETTEAQLDELMNLHLKGVFFLTQKMLPLLADGGRIVNLSSGLARFTLPECPPTPR